MRLLGFLELESRTMLSGTQFSAEQIVSQVIADDVRAVESADIDGDGDQDLLVGSSSGRTASWYENDGQGQFGSAHEIPNSMDVIGVRAGDMDGDGDQDVIVSSYDSKRMEWFENTDGGGTFSAPRLVLQGGRSTRVEAVTDLDGDGSVDLLIAERFGSNGHLEWRRNLDGQGTFGDAQWIGSTANFQQAIAGDFDDDGDIDVIVNEFDFDVSWYANSGQG